MSHPLKSRDFGSGVTLATLLDEGLIWVTGTVVGSPGPDIVGRVGCYSVKKVSFFIRVGNDAPLRAVPVFDQDP